MKKTRLLQIGYADFTPKIYEWRTPSPFSPRWLTSINHPKIRIPLRVTPHIQRREYVALLVFGLYSAL